MVRSRGLHGKDRHKTILLLCVVLLAGVLAGCTGTQDDLDSPDADGQEGGPGGGSGGGGSGGDGGGSGEGGAGGSTGRPTDPSHYRYTDEVFEVQEASASGSFAVEEHCIPQCFIGEEGYTEQIDLTDLLPVGVPVEVQVELHHDPEFAGTMGGFFLPEGAMWDEGLVARSAYTDTIIVGRPNTDARLYYVVEAILPDSTDGNSWSLDATSTPLVDRIPRGFPVAFTVDDPIQHPKILSDGLRDARFMLYGPNDEHLGDYWSTSNITGAFEQGGAGEYVVFAPWDSSTIMVKAEEGEPGTLRLLTIAMQQGELRATLPGTPSEWSFQVEKEPIAVGLLMRSETTGYMNFMSEFRLESPEATLLSQSCFLCGGALIGGTQRVFWFHGLEDGVVAGDYQVYHEDNGLSENVAEVVWTHVR